MTWDGWAGWHFPINIGCHAWIAQQGKHADVARVSYSMPTPLRDVSMAPIQTPNLFDD